MNFAWVRGLNPWFSAMCHLGWASCALDSLCAKKYYPHQIWTGIGLPQVSSKQQLESLKPIFFRLKPVTFSLLTALLVHSQWSLHLHHQLMVAKCSCVATVASVPKSCFVQSLNYTYFDSMSSCNTKICHYCYYYLF